jgi:hypothetical protein
MTNLELFLGWLASIALAAVFMAVVLFVTRLVLARDRKEVDPMAWILAASLAGGSASLIALVIL